MGLLTFLLFHLPTFSCHVYSNFTFTLFIIPSRKVFFEPNIEAYEEVTTTHFLDFEFGNPVSAVLPGDRDHRKALAAQDGLKRQFHSYVEMGRNNWAHPVDHCFTIGFEGIGCVVQPVPEHHAD